MNQITENLYLGNFLSARADSLKEKGIKKVLSVMDYYIIPESHKGDNINHKIIKAVDANSCNIIKYFGECLKFIDGEEKVLVHCAAGVSRSATVVIAYIMWKQKMNFNDAYNFVNERRLVSPNPGFRSQLELFEKELIKNDYDIDKIKFDEIEWKWEPNE